MKKNKSEKGNDDIIRTTDSDVLRFHGHQGPFGRCRGDCDSNDDCFGELVCYQRNGVENNVPGCGGLVATSNVDYCVSPSDVDDEQRQDDGNFTPTPSPTLSPSTTRTGLVTESPTYRVTFDLTYDEDDEVIVNFTPTPSPTIVPTTASSTTNSKVIAAINTDENLTSGQPGANTFNIQSTGGYAVMAFAFLSLIVLAIVGLALRKRRKQPIANEIKNKHSLSTVIVSFNNDRDGSPRWGDGSTINQLTQAFESENMGIEVIDIKSDPSIRSAPSADSFDADPNPLPYFSSLYSKYPKLFGLPERDDAGEIGPMDTIEL